MATICFRLQYDNQYGHKREDGAGSEYRCPNLGPHCKEVFLIDHKKDSFCNAPVKEIHEDFFREAHSRERAGGESSADFSGMLPCRLASCLCVCVILCVCVCVCVRLYGQLMAKLARCFNERFPPSAQQVAETYAGRL